MLSRELAQQPSEIVPLIQAAIASAERGESTKQFALSIGCGRGVSGYVLHTVPVAIHAWAMHPEDFRSAVVGAIECGGDTDTVAACVGGIVGSRVGVAGIPENWRHGMLEWPRTSDWIESLARSVHSLHSGERRVGRVSVGPFVLLRNIAFAAIVLVHIVRRALPPY
jgi:hypothetical protein